MSLSDSILNQQVVDKAQPEVALNLMVVLLGAEEVLVEKHQQELPIGLLELHIPNVFGLVSLLRGSTVIFEFILAEIEHPGINQWEVLEVLEELAGDVRGAQLENGAVHWSHDVALDALSTLAIGLIEDGLSLRSIVGV